MTFDLAAWRSYLRFFVESRPSDDSRLNGLRLLAKAKTLNNTWRKLAADVRQEGWGEPPSSSAYEALLGLADCISFPPGAIAHPSQKDVKAVTAALRRLRTAYARGNDIGRYLHSAISGALPTSKEGVDALIAKIEAIDLQAAARPLMPASQGQNGARNWLALYVRERVVPLYFRRPQDSAIADLIAVAYPDWEAFADVDQIAKLKHW